MNQERSTIPAGIEWSTDTHACEARSSGADAWAFGLDALAFAYVANTGPRWSMLRWRRDRRPRADVA